MNRDKILVEREYEGERCAFCEFKLKDEAYLSDIYFCAIFGDTIDGGMRCPACLSTPGGEVPNA